MFNQKITKIKGLSDRRRLPRLGSIRLGLKVKNQNGVEYPKETEYFVVPPEVAEVFGDKPTELEVMLPLNEIDAVFPQAYKHYGSGKGLKCQGDGEIAYYVDPNTKEMVERECPCELLDTNKCKQSATLMVMIPKVSVGGIYQIRTSSFNSIVDVNSGLDYVAALLGRFAMIPLTLRRVKTETHHDEKKQNHYTLQIVFDGDIQTINALLSDTQRVLEHPRFALPAPVDENPELEPVDIVVDEENETTETEEAKTVEETTTEPAQDASQAPEKDIQDCSPSTPEDAEKELVGTISPAQVKALIGTLKTHNVSAEEFCTKFEIGAVSELPASRNGGAIQWLLLEGKNRTRGG